jgi:hypothetical protein
MPSYLSEMYRKFAPGHNNPGDLLALHQLNDLFFQLYSDGFITNWNDTEALEVDGNRRRKSVGRPWEAFALPIVRLCEWKFLKETFGSGNDAAITYRTLHYDTLLWKNYNAILVYPQLGASELYGDEWMNLTFEVRDLKELV